jgi:hypothetical protein
VNLISGALDAVYLPYAKEWRENAIRQADEGVVAASVCHQAALLDLALFGRLRHAWNEVMDEFLTHDNKPLAYSQAYSKRLYGFGSQYQQSTIHAIHTRWWIETCLSSTTDHERFAEMVAAKRQSDGLIYDADVSETVLRHRMKSELTLSMAMAVEILAAAGRLTPQLSLELATALVDPKKCPTMGYMSAEYFRLFALQAMGQVPLMPTGLAEHVVACAKGLSVGWGDFAMASKVDAYMGTAKRTQRDKQIHSPVIACHVAALIEVLPTAQQAIEQKRLSEYSSHLRNHPADIPAFQMRDVPIPFGADRTPIEALCASHLIGLGQDKR